MRSGIQFKEDGNIVFFLCVVSHATSRVLLGSENSSVVDWPRDTTTIVTNAVCYKRVLAWLPCSEPAILQYCVDSVTNKNT